MIPSYDTCKEKGCMRPVYADTLCKRCRDLAAYRGKKRLSELKPFVARRSLIVAAQRSR